MNIPQYLRKLDANIAEHRQAIAIHQVEIARLEDARRVIIGIEERENGLEHEPMAQLNGHERPLLIARKAAALAVSDEEGTASAVAKYGEPPKKKQKAKRKLPTGEYRQYVATVEDMLKKAGLPGISSTAIIKVLGTEHRRHVWHVLDRLTKVDLAAYDRTNRVYRWIGKPDDTDTKRPSVAVVANGSRGIADRVFQIIAESPEPLTSSAVMKRMPKEKRKQPIYNALTYLYRQTNRINRRDDGTYVVAAE